MAAKHRFTHLLLWLALICLPTPALAHRVNVFAYVEGDVIHVEARFQRAEPARQSGVEVRNAATGRIYLNGETDAEGRFTFPIPAQARSDRADLDILLRAGEGHQNHWTLKASEYLPAVAASTPPRSKPDAQTAAKLATEPEPSPLVCPPPDPAPLRQKLLDSQQPGLREIVAGIGYLVGIAGLLAYARARRKPGNHR